MFLKKRILFAIPVLLILVGMLLWSKYAGTVAVWQPQAQETDIMQNKAQVIRNQLEYLVVKAKDVTADEMAALDCTPVLKTPFFEIHRVKHHNYRPVSDKRQVERIMQQTGLKLRELTISLSGDSAESVTANDEKTLNKKDTYLLLNDAHMLLTADDTTGEYYDTVYQRYAGWALTSTGTHSADTWQNISAIADAFETDGILMAGDMVDFASSTNYELFRQGLDKIKTPVLYARADHDLSAWYNSDGSYTNEDGKEAQKNLADYQDMMVWEKENYIILAWNNSTSQLTPEGLRVAKETWSKGKPVILLTHVPINSPVDSGLYEAACAYDPQNRAKLWGEHCLYVPDAVTQEFLDMVLDEASPVRAVLSGHLHFQYDVRLNSHLMEYVFAPTFEGNMARITVVEE